MAKPTALAILCRLALLAMAASILAACAPAAPESGDTEAAGTPSSPVPIDDLLVYVPAGSFYMGSDMEADPLADEDELPLHDVLLPGFFIYRNEVSNGLYKQCVAAGECSNPEMFDEAPSTHYDDPAYADYPVVGVNWDQANAFCSWADARLPSEAEWEKTARGELGNTYPWGDDAPSCSLNNMEGCITDPPDTDMVGQYPEGDSYYEAGDLAGNVWEWTSDFYIPDYYSQSPDVNPLGPESGELRVVRGGSFDSDPADLRAAARMGLDPLEAYNNVGFRCVPLGEEAPLAAPFCQPNYVQLCRDPNNPNDDCTPPTVGDGDQPVGDDYDLTGFGCPDANGWVTITIDGEIGDDHTVSVGGYDFICTESGIPNRWLCSGPHPPEGTLTTVTVCPDTSQGTSNGNNLVAYQPQAQGPEAPSLQGYVPAKQDNGNQLVAYQAAQIQQPELEAFAPSNDDAPSLVAYQSESYSCPEGYVINPATGQCEQDPGGSCKPGWTYNPETYLCEPDGEEGCPEGTTYNADQQGCTPNTGEECPEGFTYFAASNTCEPPSNDDGGGACPQGYFFDRTINCCSPIVDDGCDDGSYRSVANNECVPLDENGCQEGYSYNRYEGACVPDPGDGQTPPTTENGCDEGYVMNDAGQCVPGDTTQTQRILNTQCGIGGYWDPNLMSCIYPEDGQCGAGFHRGEVSDQCQPNDGPGSGCPIGYAYSERANCCVETPGNDGSTCPGDDGQTGRLITFAAAPTNYDYGQGYCDPPDDQQCPDGYMFDEQQNGCVPVNTTGRILQTSCPEGTTYDEQLGYCVQDVCGCPLGTYMNTDTQECVPYGDQTTEGECWSYTVSVPECQDITPTPHPECDNDERWNPQTMQCEPDEDPLSCADYGSQTACSAAGCSWVCVNPNGCTPTFNGPYGCR